MVDSRKIAVLGAGRIGESLISGLLSSGWREPSEVAATTRRAERVAELRERYGIEATLSNHDAAAGAALVVIAVKPQDIEGLLGEIGALILPDQTVLTAVGVPKGRPKPDISTPDALKKALLAAKRIGYEDPDFTVAGQGPLEALTKLGIFEQVASKSEVELGPGAQGISPEATRNTVKTATRLANGDIDIGMLMLSDMLPEKDKYDIVGVLPRNVTAPVPVVGFISAHASDPAGAKALLDYLASSDAQAIWKEAGYGPPEH